MKKLLLLLSIVFITINTFGQATGYNLSNFASSGSIGTAASTVDVYSRININQTTPSITLTVPPPTNTSTKVVEVWIANKGTVSFTLRPLPDATGFALDTGKFVILKWIGARYTVSGGGSSGGGGSGTVTSVSVATANGFSGTVANATTTPAITLSQQDATTSQSGKLTSTDWNTFNSKQSIPSIINSSVTAKNDSVYTVVASATFTDPSPVEGKGFRVFVRNGTATVGGTAYSIAGTIINRVFHSGAWANYESQVKLTLTTTGSSGSSTLTGSTLNVPTYTLAGLGGVGAGESLIESNIPTVNSTGRLINSGYLISQMLKDVSGNILIDVNGNIRSRSLIGAFRFQMPTTVGNWGDALTNPNSSTIRVGAGFSFVQIATLLPVSNGAGQLGENSTRYASAFINNNFLNNIAAGSTAGGSLVVGLSNNSGSISQSLSNNTNITNPLALVTATNTGTAGAGDIFVFPGLPTGGGVGGRFHLFSQTRNTTTTLGQRTILIDNASTAPTTGYGSGVVVWSQSQKLNVSNSLVLPFIGSGIEIKTGTNARAGTGTLSGGTVTINNTSITANTLIIITATETGTLTGTLRVTGRSAGTSFTVGSSIGTDDVTFSYLLIEGN